jgi:hypothetical protein
MFLHGGPGHIFFNMLALYFFGPRLEARTPFPGALPHRRHLRRFSFTSR